MTTINRGELFILQHGLKHDRTYIDGLFVAIKNIDLDEYMMNYLLVHKSIRPSTFARWMVNNKAIAPVKARVISDVRDTGDRHEIVDLTNLGTTYTGRGGSE